MIAIDSSVLIDLLAGSADTAEGAEASLRQCLSVGPVVVCDVVLTEITTALRNGAEAVSALEDMGIAYVAVESKAAVRAGEMQRRYRQRGAVAAPAPLRGGARKRSFDDPRERTGSDFLVGAHALLQCDALITRDAAFYRDYFKGLKLIVPKAG
jgi:predicted nucleic acid-binding protein